MKDRHQTLRFGLTLVALLAATTLQAETYEELNQRINETAKRQMTLQSTTLEREKRLTQALAKGTHDSPEMKETRKLIKKLKNDLFEAEQKLKEQFEALPALQDEIKNVQQSRKEIRKLDEQRQELIRKRDAFFNKDDTKTAD